MTTNSFLGIGSMAGFSSAADGLAVDMVGIVGKLQSLGFCLDLDGSDDLRGVFERVLWLFLTELHSVREGRPVPVILGDGRVVDLFKLYLAVRGRGGYRSVTSWPSVAEEVGLDSVTVPALKLVYSMYLDDMDRWLREALDEVTPPEKEVLRLEIEVKKEDNGVVPSTPNGQKTDGLCRPSSSGTKREQFLTHVRRGGHKLDFDSVSEVEFGNGSFSLKRKKGNLEDMLNWIKCVAKKPRDPSVGNVFSSREKYHGHAIGELFSQALVAREARLIIRNHCSRNGGSLVQDTLEMHHPDFPVAGNDSAKRRCNGSSHTVNRQTDSGFGLELCTLEYLMKKGSSDKFPGVISLGHSFQAIVPLWTGKPSGIYDSGSLKWLGTRIFPPQCQLNRQAYEQQPIGEGRPETCRCARPDSIECVRFHVADKRFQLKCELGPAFDTWKFDDMGEQVALSWTEEEQRAFKAVVRQNPPSEQFFWETLHSSFPKKGKKNIVRYYFNVFVIARRSYQNRVLPKKIDTDDDETEYNFLSLPYGHDVVRIPDSKYTFCIQNTECMDIDEHVNGDLVQVC